MLSVTHHQEKANQNQNKKTFHPHSNTYYEKGKNNWWQQCAKPRCVTHCDWRCRPNLASVVKGKQDPLKTRNGTTIWCNNSSAGYTSKRKEPSMSKRHLHNFLKYIQFTTSKIQNQPKWSLVDEWKKSITHIHARMCAHTHARVRAGAQTGLLFSH